MSSERFQLVGTRFSTFTRSVAMALNVKGHKFTWTPAPPHSTGELHHPLGFIPILYDHDNSIRLTECSAIISYIDRISDSEEIPSLFLPSLSTQLPERIHELVSFGSTHLFRACEFGVVKPIIFNLGVEEGRNTVDQVVAKGLLELKPVLAALEKMLEVEGGPYAIGMRISAADLVLLPPILDLEALPEGEILNGFVRISAWLNFMKEHDAVKGTEAGTLAVGGRP